MRPIVRATTTITTTIMMTTGIIIMRATMTLFPWLLNASFITPWVAGDYKSDNCWQSPMRTSLGIPGLEKVPLSPHGFIAVLPDQAEKSDMICVLFGGDIPCVLCPSGSAYKFVACG